MSSTVYRNKLVEVLARSNRQKEAWNKAMENAQTKKKWNIVRGDRVQVTGRHPEKGKQGVVLQVLRKEDRLLISGVNIKTTNVAGDKDRGIKGRQETKERSIPYSCASLLDPVQNVPTKIVKKYLEDGTKVRVSKLTGSIIPRPEILRERRAPIRLTVTNVDTAEADAWEMSYAPPDLSSRTNQTKLRPDETDIV